MYLKDNPILSICIPTHGVVEFVIPAIESIYQQGCDLSLFEVVISDNGQDSVLGEALEKYDYPNLIYKRVAAGGFMNEVNSLRYGNGLFLKIMNHKSRLKDGVLQKMIDFVLANKDDKPMLFFSNGHVKGESIIPCDSLEMFLRKVSFWSSWEEGVGIWAEEKELLDGIPYNEMVPTSSVLFYLRDSSKYVIFNEVMSDQEGTKRKRMYDFFQVFAIGYVDGYNELRKNGKISIDLFNFLRYDLYRRDLISHYYQIMVAKTDDSIPLSGIKQTMSVYYSSLHYYYMLLYAYIAMPVKRLLWR